MQERLDYKKIINTNKYKYYNNNNGDKATRQN